MVGLINGPRGDATVTAIDAEGVHFSVQWDPEAMPPPPEITLLLATPRPATARKILFEATTLGVRSMQFFRSEKGDPAYVRSRLWTGEWRESVRRGAEQAFSSFIPEVTLHDSLAAAAGAIPLSGPRLALDVYEGTARLSEQAPPDPPLVLAFGGERGWSQRERVQLREAGFTLVSLGERVLRLETAVTAALAVCFARAGRF